MYVAVAPGEHGGGTLRPLGADRDGTAGPRMVTDLAAAVRELEAAEAPRWVWADTRAVYPALLAAGARVGRCHDLALTEALLLGYEGRYGEPRSARAAYARLHGLPVPPDEDVPPGRDDPAQAALFDLRALDASAGIGGTARRAPPSGTAGRARPRSTWWPRCTPTRSAASPPPPTRAGSGCWWPPSRPPRSPPPRWPTRACRGGATCTTPCSPSCSAPGRRTACARPGCRRSPTR